MDKNKEKLEELITIYNFLMELFKNDNNIYTILLDFKNSILTFNMTSENFNITKYINCTKLEAVETIDLIRDNFILNHDITLPQRGKVLIKLPDTDFYSYVMCHNLKNTKFELFVTIRSKDDETRMNIAQKKAMEKNNEQITYKKRLTN